jgi:hypothetical protein
MVSFDEIDDWSPRLSAALRPFVSSSVAHTVAEAAPEYIEDACELLFELANREAVIDATLTWIRSTTIAGYHGTRLTEAEVASVLSAGLVPLKAAARRERLVRALSTDPRWATVEGRLDAVIEAHGHGKSAGSREGQVHLTLSRESLTNGFNHYLTHGAEFDQRVAQDLLGPPGKDLLARDGQPRVIHVAVPGALALKAAHPYLTIEELLAREEVPNLARSFLEAWSYRLSDRQFQCRSSKVDVGMIFYQAVPAAWITRIETLAT